jgi:hypothetical protein
MTAADALECEQAAMSGAMNAQRFDGVLRATRRVATTAAEEWAEGHLVEAYEEEKKDAHGSPPPFALQQAQHFALQPRKVELGRTGTRGDNVVMALGEGKCPATKELAQASFEQIAIVRFADFA